MVRPPVVMIPVFAAGGLRRTRPIALFLLNFMTMANRPRVLNLLGNNFSIPTAGTKSAHGNYKVNRVPVHSSETLIKSPESRRPTPDSDVYKMEALVSMPRSPEIDQRRKQLPWPPELRT
jgi:hypothetical protein